MSQQNFDVNQWRKRVLELRWRHTKKEDLEFCDLVEKVAGINQINIVQTLFDTFTNWGDIGVQQTVVRILGSFDIVMYYQAYLEALPRLVSDNAGWEIDLGAFPERDPTNSEVIAISKIVKSMPDETIKQFLKVLTDSDFSNENKWAEPLAKMLQS